MNKYLSSNKIKVIITPIQLSILIISILSLIILNFNDFSNRIKLEANIYDFLIYIFNNYFFSMFVVPIVFLVIIYKYTSDLNNYIFLRFKNRKHWVINNFKYIAKLALVFISSLLILITIVCLVFNLSISPEWSKLSLDMYQNFPDLLKYNPIIIILTQLFLFYMYIVILALLLFIINVSIKNSVLSFLIIISLNFFNIGIILSKLHVLGKLSFGYNMLLSFHSLGIELQYPSIKFSIIYWIVVTLCIYIYAIKCITKIDIV